MSCDALFVYVCLSLLYLLACTDDKFNLGEALIISESNLNHHHVFREHDDSQPSRRRREASLAPDNVAALNSSNSVITLVHLNDSHEQLTVHWAGKNSPVIICLAKNRKISRRNQSSAVYISRNYGKTFDGIHLKLKDGSPAIVDTFFISPVLNEKLFIFVASSNRCIFITRDSGRNFQRADLDFTPKSFQFHPTIPNLLLASSSIGNSTDSSLYVTENFGLKWKKIQDKIRYFSWDDSIELNQDAKTVFILRNEPSGLATILSSVDFFVNTKVWLTNVEEIEINGQFIFATRRLSLLGSLGHSSASHESYQLWISINRTEFSRALIPWPNSEPVNYHIADSTPEVVFLAVTFQNGSTNLYTSDHKFETFALSVENLVYYNSKVTKKPILHFDTVNGQEFSDLHRVSGIRGAYIINRWRNSTKKSSVSDIESLMTRDFGRRWHPLTAPKQDALGRETCHASGHSNCSLHLVQRYVSALSTGLKTIMSRDSAPGLLVGTGVTGDSLKGAQGVFLTVDAGTTWKQVFSRNMLYAFGDFGSIIVAVAHYSRGGVVNKLYYSLDDGDSFREMSLGESMRIYGLLTEPGEKTAVFTIFGSREKSHEWIVIQANFTSLFHSQCARNDYSEWSPHDYESDCLLGTTTIFTRRISNRKCFNGMDFKRPTALINCPCKYSDYECEKGYIRDHHSGGLKCLLNETLRDALEVDSDQLANCKPGQLFNKTKGYRKVFGNNCEGGEDSYYDPLLLPCPLSANESEFILFVQRQDISMISLNSENFSKSSIVPKQFLSNAIAADYDSLLRCVIWSDISLNVIKRFCLNGTQVQPEVLVETELYSVEGIAFNAINRLLYFVNGFKSKVELINVDAHHQGLMRRTIISKPNLDKPRGIALDPIEGYLFITDWSSTNPAIVRSELDGENVKLLFNSNTVTWPNGITVDHRSKQIFWVDAKHDYIATSSFEGTQLKYILRGDQAPHPFALGVFKDVIFYDDWNLHKLVLVSKHNATIRQEILNDVTGAMDLKIITPFFSNLSNGCSQNHTCSHLCIQKPFNGFRCLCPDGLVSTVTPDGNEKCSCPPNEELTSTGACKPLQPNVTCGSNEFTCANGNCISVFWKCDSEGDCGDGSDEDEQLCKQHECQAGEFQCLTSRKCISILYMCDHSAECSDHSDEDINLCSAYYPKCNLTTSFQCKNHRCISKSHVCDGIDHCLDGTDESECFHNETTHSAQNATCDKSHFHCSDGACIPKMWRCDGHFDCLDKSDENSCQNHTCSETEFRCSDFLCIDSNWVCDGDLDCDQGVDEQNCSTSTGQDTNGTSLQPNIFIDGDCPEGWLQCHNRKCIPLEWHCDGVFDCDSDEIGCEFQRNHDHANDTSQVSGNQTNSSCGPNKFFCAITGQCILRSYLCDGDLDCTSGEDEVNCSYSRNTCPPGTFTCVLKPECIPIKKVCDGNKRDCADGSDEWGCTNRLEPVPSICLGFSCKSGECINSLQRCDGKNDCFDDSDEENCQEKMFSVQELHVVHDSITEQGFSIAWKSPNSSLDFLYMPAYANYADDEHQKPVNTSWTEATQHTFSQLLSGHTYKVYVYCKLVDLTSRFDKVFSPTSFIKVTTVSVAPRPPEKFTAEEIGYNRVLLKWQMPMINEPIHGYKLYYSPPYPPSRKLLDFKSEQYELTGLFSIGVNYTFWMTTLTKNLESADSNKVSLVIQPAAIISDLQQRNITNSTVTLEWKWHSASSVISKWFIVYRCDDYFPIFVKNLTVTQDNASVGHLSPGVNYQFKLFPVVNNTILYDAVQDNMISVRTLGPQLPIVDSVDSTVSGSVVSLHWNAPPRFPPTDWEYAIYIGSHLSNLKLVSQTKDTKIVMKLMSCEHYIVEVRVIKPFGIGPAQYAHKFNTTFDPKSPPKNLNFQPVNSENTKYRISWDASCSEQFNYHKIGYIVSVKDLIIGSEDRFRFQPNHDLTHSFDLSVHWGAVYEIKVSTDHPEARWSEKVALTPPLMPKVPKPRGFMDDKGDLHITWKTVDRNYPKDYQAHKFRYKVLVSTSEDMQSAADSLVVSEPPALLKMPKAAPRYYFAVILLDNHGYVGPVSETSSCPSMDLYSSSNHLRNDLLVMPLILMVIILIILVVFIVKRVTSKRSTPFMNSHYNCRSDSFASYNNHTEETVYSDDAPLI